MIDRVAALGKAELVARILGILKEALVAFDGGSADGLDSVTATSPLLGENAVIQSLGLVSVIADVEMSLSEGDGLELTLVSEEALSRSRSPFRTVDALADYVLELSAGGVAPVAEE